LFSRRDAKAQRVKGIGGAGAPSGFMLFFAALRPGAGPLFLQIAYYSGNTMFHQGFSEIEKIIILPKNWTVV
jgi:hypothetical protein